jgi:hypothetical protein
LGGEIAPYYFGHNYSSISVINCYNYVNGKKNIHEGEEA